MEILKDQAIKQIEEVCSDFRISFDISYTEEFPATNNSDECTDIISKASSYLSLPSHKLELPFRWSEDFGHFTQLGKAALFGVGSGENHPQLHNEDYDFPDDIIEPAVLLMHRIACTTVEKEYSPSR